MSDQLKEQLLEARSDVARLQRRVAQLEDDNARLERRTLPSVRLDDEDFMRVCWRYQGRVVVLVFDRNSASLHRGSHPTKDAPVVAGGTLLEVKHLCDAFAWLKCP